MKHAIVKLPGKRKWLVRGLLTGKHLGTYNSRPAAIKRLRQVQYFMRRK